MIDDIGQGRRIKGKEKERKDKQVKERKRKETAVGKRNARDGKSTKREYLETALVM